MKPLPRSLSLPSLFAGALGALLLASASGGPAQEAEGLDQAMAEAMAKAQAYTQPGEHHALLERFLGRWSTKTSFLMGGQRTPGEDGQVEITWLMEGRWIQIRGGGRMMGMPVEIFSVMGYDNFRRSYVATSVSTMDTAMNRAEGDLDPGGKALLLYGTIDEYFTGEVGKMVKTVWRFVSEDVLVQEIHDLPIGERDTQVVEVRYERVR